MAAAKTWKGPSTALVEATDSPQYNLAEKFQLIQIFYGLYSYCQTQVTTTFAPGTIGTGVTLGYTIAGAQLVKERGDVGKITVTWETAGSSSGQPLPADEFGVSPSDLSPRLERHPRYVALADPARLVAGVDDSGAASDDVQELMAVQAAARAQKAVLRNAWYASLSDLGKELVLKLERGHETYYMAGLRYAWVTHSWSAPSTTRGGFRQHPDAYAHPLLGYFAGDIDWLREADDLQYQNGIYRITRAWLGGALGHWDFTIYSP